MCLLFALWYKLKMMENFETTYESSIPTSFVDGHGDVRDLVDPPSQDFWKEDGISLVGNPLTSSTSPDTINFSTSYGSSIPKELPYPYEYNVDGNVTARTNSNTIINNSPAIPWKYNEDKIAKELLEYVRGTYNQHYSAGDDKIQTLDLIEACGDGEAFCRSNILKYASRYDKKGTARRDIMKILHYAVLLMNFNDKNAEREVHFK